MRVVFTYLPIRLKEVTEIYLKYSIENLNNQNIIPIIYSDKDYFKNTQLKYDWIEFDIDEKYKKSALWSYPKLKVLSTISFPFIHLDNDLNYDFFIERYGDIPPITLNQQYLNLYFNNINYLFNENPSYDDIVKNGVCHLSEKNMISNFIKNKNLI